MGANTEMSRLDSIPTEKLNELLQMQGLPAATASDAGKVPVVNDDGAWELGETQAGGGGTGSPIEILTVTENEGTYTLNKTWAELLAGASQGKMYYLARTDTPDGGGLYLMAGFLSDLRIDYGTYQVCFAGEGNLFFESSTEDGPLHTDSTLN